VNGSLSIGSRRAKIIILLALLFVILNGIALTQELYAFAALPLLVPGAWLLLYRPKTLLLVMVFCTPLSFNFENLTGFGGIGFYFPTEPVFFVLMILYILKILSGYSINREFLRHPLTLAIVFNLVWIGITAWFSMNFVVSMKFLVSRLWFVLVLYFMINPFFESRTYIRNFILLFSISMAIVVLYTVSHHAIFAFSEEAGHWVMSPFFKDHTSYGAVLAMFIPLIIIHLISARGFSLDQLLWFLLFFLFAVGTVLSYTRAAWVSLAGALGVYFLIRFRINYKLVLLVAAVLTGFFFAFQVQILHQLEKNRQDSSDSFAEHIQSITNISSDASNLERLNRWNSAIRMFLDKPIMGHGPGMYMFEYAKYQKSSDRTIISTNTADAGNAHSEYLGPLSESGVLGFLSILVIFILSLSLGVKLYYQLDHDLYLRGVVLGLVLGLVTYYLHGILNNFLDTDKASVPVWGFMSMLVAIQIYHLNRQQSKAVSSK
jgi:O-antigen ligase